MEQMNISNQDLAYLAGLFDGEGCVNFAIITSKKNKTLFNLGGNLIITNTNLEVLEWCQNLIGEGHIIKNQTPSRGVERGHKPCFRFILEQKAAYNFSPILLPYLKIKGGPLKYFIAYFEARQTRGNNAPYSKKEIELFFEGKKLVQGNDNFIVLKKEKYSFEEFATMILEARSNSNYNVFEWNENSINLLGTDTDGVIATELGVTRPVVQKKRKALKIKPFRSFRSLSFYE
jgi:hypothetical protein